ncbi:hypothetical protein ACFYOW_21935 [Nocardia sp. NPDC006982]
MSVEDEVRMTVAQSAVDDVDRWTSTTDGFPVHALLPRSGI